MSEDPTPISDELVSAYLDGEVTDVERATVEGDDEAMARVAALRLARDAVAAPVDSPSDADRDRIIAAALAVSATSPVVTSIDTARSSLRRQWRPLAAVAAVALALVVAVAALNGLDLGSDAGDTAAETSSDLASDAALDRDAMEAAEEPADDSGDATSAAPTEMEATAADDSIDTGDDTAEAAADEAAEEPAAEPADEATDDSGDAGEGADGGATSFEPLAASLGDFASADLIVEQALTDYESWRDDPVATSSRNAAVDGEPEELCLDDLGLTERVDEETSDAAVASVGADQYVIWLFDDGTVFVAPASTCSPVATGDAAGN